MTSSSVHPSPSTSPSRAFPLPLAPVHVDGLGLLLDLALEATAATGAALLAPDGDQLRVVETRGANAPLPDETLPIEGSVAGEAWYKSRLVSGAERPPRGRQAALWQEDRTVDVMAVPVVVAGRPAAAFVLYHRHLGHFRRSDATNLSRLASIASGLWGAPGSVAAPHEARSHLEVRAASRLALVAASQFAGTGAVAGAAAIGDAGYSMLIGILLLMSLPGIAGPMLMRSKLIVR